MKIEDLLKLVDAGFSKTDIIALASGQVQQISPQPQQEPAPDPEPQPAQQTQEPTQPQTPQTNELSADIADIKSQLNALQKSNIMNASQPAGAAKKETVDDVWKSFFEGDEN